jgi:hypothetical protein
VKVKQIMDECKHLDRLMARDVEMRDSEADIKSETFPNRADTHSGPPCTLEKLFGEERHDDRLHSDDENSPVRICPPTRRDVVFSSNRTCQFSSVGITISKHCNRLKGDIVEALQFMKCLIRRDLVFRIDPPTSIDSDLSDEDDDITTQDGSVMAGSTMAPDTEKLLSSWDELWLEDDDATEG